MTIKREKKSAKKRTLYGAAFLCECCGSKTSRFSALPRASWCHVCSNIWERAFFAAITGLASGGTPNGIAKDAAAIADSATTEVRANLYRGKH